MCRHSNYDCLQFSLIWSNSIFIVAAYDGFFQTVFHSFGNIKKVFPGVKYLLVVLNYVLSCLKSPNINGNICLYQ